MENNNYIIPLSPVTKKNHQVIAHNKATGKLFIAQSKQYREYEAKALRFLRPKPKVPIEKSVEVKCLFYMPTRRKVDLPNLIAAIDDILVKGGILKDDNSNIIVSHDGSRVLYDKNNPRTVVYITEIEKQKNGE